MPHSWHWVAPLGPGLVARDARDARDAAALCVAGVALGDIHLDFTWQAWHNLTSTVVLRGRRLTHGTATVVLRGRRLTHGTGWVLGPGLVARDARDAAALCVAGVALGDINLDFTWQAWHNLTSMTPRHFCVAGVALGDIHLDFTWQAWHNLTSMTPRHFCVAGVALGDIHLDFTWQVWHNLTSTVVLRGRRGPYGIGLAVVSHAIFVTHHLSHSVTHSFTHHL